MPLPIHGRARSAIGHYNLRTRLAPPVRFLAEDSWPVKPNRARRNSVEMAKEGLTLDHNSNNFRSSSEVNSDETVAETVVNASSIPLMSTYSENINVETTMSLLTSVVESTSTTVPAPVAGMAPLATSTQSHQNSPNHEELENPTL